MRKAPSDAFPTGQHCSHPGHAGPAERSTAGVGEAMREPLAHRLARPIQKLC